MKKTTYIYLVLCVLSIFSGTELVQAQNIKYMMMGNSITAGVESVFNGGYTGYRRHMYQALKSDGYNFTLVGSQGGGVYDGLETRNEGYSGIDAPGMINNITQRNILSLNVPDVISVKIGTNDNGYMGGSDPNAPKNAIKNLERLLDTIFYYLPNVKMVVVCPIQAWEEAFNMKFNMPRFEVEVRKLVEKMVSEGKDVIYCDMYHIDLYDSDSNDGTHPLETGFMKMARNLYPYVKYMCDEFLTKIEIRNFKLTSKVIYNNPGDTIGFRAKITGAANITGATLDLSSLGISTKPAMTKTGNSFYCNIQVPSGLTPGEYKVYIEATDATSKVNKAFLTVRVVNTGEATLYGLIPSDGDLVPRFSKEIKNYTVNYKTTKSNMYFIPRASDPACSSIKINGISVKSDTLSSLFSYDATKVKVFTIEVTGSTGQKEIYTVAYSNQTEILVDNNQATATGTWSIDYTGETSYGSNVYTDDNSGKGTKSLRYTPSISQAGFYNVFAGYCMYNKSLIGLARATNIPITVAHKNGTSNLTLNEQEIPEYYAGLSKYIGTFEFEAGTTGTVTISNAGTDNFVTADVMRFERIPDTIAALYTVHPDSVSLNEKILTLQINQTFQLTPIVYPGYTTDKRVTWLSSNTSIATVSSIGLLTAKTQGSSVITVTTVDGGKTSVCSLTVTIGAVPITSLSVNPANLNISINQTSTLVATITPVNASNKSVVWASLNSSIASVDQNGIVTGIAEGNTIITATSVQGSKTDSCKITVSPKKFSELLTGTVIGTDGSWGSNPATTRGSAFDKNIGTFFDSPIENGSWVGLDLGSNYIIDSIRFYPRSDYPSRMAGGKFQVSSTADFSSDVTDIFTIETTPVVAWSSGEVTISSGYRYIRYLSPNNGWGNVAEIEFWGSPAINTTIGNIISKTFNIYPNPAGEFLSVSNIDSESIISIYDVNGSLQIQENSNSNASTINISKLNNGVYVIKVRSNEKVVTKKFIKK